MNTILIIILLAVVVLIIASLAVGRTTHEVESARDTEYLELEGDWIRYNVIGGGPPVVLVHGWLSSSAVWEQLAQRLSQRFTVYTLDLPGFGESDKPLEGYGVRYGSRLLYAFCAHFGLTRVSVIGHDIGGDMVMKLASDHPDVVGRIVLVATPANEEQIDLPTSLWAATLPVVGPLFYALGRSVRPIRASWMRAFVSESEDVTDEMIEDSASSTPAAMSKTLSVSKREIAGGRLARQSRMVRVPVLIVTGEEDQIVDPQAAGVWSKSLDQSEVCLMDECGHMPMIERTGEFNAQILAFLTGDARYLEYIEQSSSQNTGIDPDINTEEDTIEVGTLPPEGEDPAFDKGLFSPGPRKKRDDDEPEDGELPNNSRLRRARPRRLSGEEPGERYPGTESPFRPLDAQPPVEENEADEPDTLDTPDTPDDRERGDDQDPGVVRRFGGARSSRPSARRHSRPWNFDENEEEPANENSPESDFRDLSTGGSNESVEAEEEREARSEREGFFFGRTNDRADIEREDSTEDLSEPSRPGGEFIPREEMPPREEHSSGEERTYSGVNETPEPPRREEPAPPRRRSREDHGEEGSVPEVPEGLFDWGSSLDDFEPVDRSRARRRRRRAEGEEPPSGDEGNEGNSNDDFRV